MRVRDIMTSPAVSAPPDATVADAAALMVEQRIGSVVVVDAEDPTRAVGIFSESEMELAETLLPLSLPTTRATRLLDLWAQSPEQLDEALVSVARRALCDVMRTPACTIEAEADVWTAMSRMAELDITRMPVLEDGRLVGLVARHDLLKALLALARDDGGEPGGG
jgi:CBS domain-containing protein